MTRLPLQSTRFNGLQQLIGKQLLGWVTSGWLQKSLGLISLLGGLTWPPTSLRYT